MKAKVTLLYSAVMGCVCANWVIIHGAVVKVLHAMLQWLSSLLIDYLNGMPYGILWAVGSAMPKACPCSSVKA